MARPMTLDELQAALRDAARPAGDDGGFLLREIVAATRLPADRVGQMIREGMAKGTVVRSQRTTERIDGHAQTVTTFVFLDSTPAKKARRK